MIDRALLWGSVQRNTTGLGLMRCGLGWIMAYIYAINYAQRDLFFGPARISPSPNGLFGLLPAEAGFQVMYHLAFLAAILFAIGWGGRSLTIVNFLFFWSLTSATTMSGDGGDNLLRLVLFYMIFANVSGKNAEAKQDLGGQVVGIVHNIAWVAIVTQLCILYWDAGYQKAGGDMWRDGTALYYILQVNEFRNPLVADLLLRSPLLLVVSTYATTIFQLAFPFMMFNRWTKYVAIGISISFHLGIMFSMCLVSFSAIMMSTELALLSNADYERLGRAWDRLRSAVRLDRGAAPEKRSLGTVSNAE